MESKIPIKQSLSKPSFYNQVLQHLKRKWYKKTGKLPEIPWMAQKELDILEEIITNLRPNRCLEWGTGFSTIYFTRLLPKNPQWISIEHNEEWFQTMQAKNLPEGVSLNFIPADNPSFHYTNGDGSFLDFKKYIEFPEGKFDLIFIDGRARNACLTKAQELVSDYGVVILHDVNRKTYHEQLHLFPNQIIFRDHRKNFGGIWIGSKNLSLENVLRIRLHLSLWKKHLSLLRLIRPFYQLKNA